MSIVFGCAHIDQGRTGMTEKTLSGLLLGLLYLASGRNLGMPMIARFFRLARFYAHLFAETSGNEVRLLDCC